LYKKLILRIFNTKHLIKINKHGDLYGLRHSYATHLHEKGIDTAIPELSGHNSIKQPKQIQTFLRNEWMIPEVLQTIWIF